MFTLSLFIRARFALRLFAAATILSSALTAFAQSSVTLAWDPSSEANITGYRLYYGTASRGYTNSTPSTTPNATVSGLTAGVKYYFAVTARNSAGLESDYSSEISFVPAASGGSNPTNSTPTNTAPALGLVAAYAFDEGSGASTKDVSGNANAGALNGSTWTTAGKYGNALAFNGTSSSVLVNDSATLDLVGTFTLEAWVNPSRVDGWREVVYKGDDNYYLEAATTLGAGPGFGFNGTTTSTMLSGPTALPLNIWSHVAAVYDGTTMRLYVNGAEVASKPRSGPLSPSNLPLTLGADTIHGSYFAGLIDEVRIYNRPLSSAEVQKDMATPLTGSTPPSTTTPAIVLTGPSSGTAYSAPGTIQLAASVTANGQTISKVQFYNGNTLINEDSAAPYSFAWGSVPAGSYPLSARALYGVGNVVTSAVATVTVTNVPVTPTTPPAIVLSSPASGSSFAAPATVALNATVTPNGHTINKVQFYNGGTLLNEDTVAPYSFSWGGVPVGSYQLSARAVFNTTNSVSSSLASVTVTNQSTTQPPSTNNPLSLPWQTLDIGSPSVAGSAQGTNGSYTIAGSGALTGASDSFRFVYQPLNWDGEISARILSQQNTGSVARAGVMIRETLSGNSRYSFMGLSGDNRLTFQSRSSTGGSTLSSQYYQGSPPAQWVKLVRSAHTLYGYSSADGTNWTLRTSRVISMADHIQVGLAVASGSASLNTATVTNVNVRR